MGLRTIGINGVNLSFPDDLVLVWDETGVWLSYAPATQAEREEAANALSAPSSALSAPLGSLLASPGPGRPAQPQDVSLAAVRAAVAPVEKKKRVRRVIPAALRALPANIDALVDDAIRTAGGSIAARALWQVLFGRGTAKHFGSLDEVLRQRLRERVGRGELVLLRDGFGQQGISSVYGLPPETVPGTVYPEVKLAGQYGETGTTNDTDVI